MSSEHLKDSSEGNQHVSWVLTSMTQFDERHFSNGLNKSPSTQKKGVRISQDGVSVPLDVDVNEASNSFLKRKPGNTGLMLDA